MRRQRATPDLRSRNPVQGLGLVRHRLRGQRFISVHQRGRRRRIEVRQVRKIRESREIGDKIERYQIVREILERQILVKERQKVTSLDALAQSKFQSLQIRSKLIPELWILQCDLHRRFQKSQLIASVMRLTVVDPRV